MSNDKSQSLPLRQRKFARTKLGLLEATIRLVDAGDFESIRIKDICAAAEVSEASFFNYFPSKVDLLVYFIQLWSLEMAWHGARLAHTHGGLAAIEEIFRLTARRLVAHPNLMGEIIAFQARMRKPPALVPIGAAERQLAFPDLEGIETVVASDLKSLVLPFLQHAQSVGELPKNLDLGAALLAIAAIFFGVPVALRSQTPRQIGPAYEAQLRLLWAGLTGRKT